MHFARPIDRYQRLPLRALHVRGSPSQLERP
jgi:hypothetical protein